MLRVSRADPDLVGPWRGRGGNPPGRVSAGARWLGVAVPGRFRSGPGCLMPLPPPQLLCPILIPSRTNPKASSRSTTAWSYMARWMRSAVRRLEARSAGFTSRASSTGLVRSCTASIMIGGRLGPRGGPTQAGRSALERSWGIPCSCGRSVFVLLPDKQRLPHAPQNHPSHPGL